MTAEDLEFLKATCAERPYLVHARNIIGKWVDGKYREKRPVLSLFADAYLKYLRGNISLVGYDEPVIGERVRLLNGYYKFFDDYDATHEKKVDQIFSAQSKFRSTVLEEFLAILLKDVVDDLLQDVPDPKIEIGSVKAYANLYFYGKNFPVFARDVALGINEKDQDFAVYRRVKISMDGERPREICVPVVAMECKTYVDKTMFEGAAATAEKLKAGNPCTWFSIVAETYEIDKTFIPAYSRIDQVYVLRKGCRKESRKPIDRAVVKRIVNDVSTHLKRQWVDVETKLKDDGVLI